MARATTNRLEIVRGAGWLLNDGWMVFAFDGKASGAKRKEKDLPHSYIHRN